MTEINTVESQDLTPLLNLKVLSTWTLDRQGVHNIDLATYERGLATFQTALRSQHVEGDRTGMLGSWQRASRARRVLKPWKKLVKTQRDAAAAAEELRVAYADHVALVAALPQQRRDKAEAKLNRRQAAGALASKSLHKTASNMAPSGSEDEDSGETAGKGPAPAQSGPIRGINDLFHKAG
ncbi:hypothetical protein [Streptomyces cahuitamycinicus]|uniref:Uncharacterized protein n=1 Tax=Streptomyces cahuitamycinicus TaxID=2070367 RepID=A0A2N8THW3_9ACTN|nr:hypothetical protein [Streptomyces cahuitamycinicus]PNG18631.1 hypothetical protein C1J00_30030 [Streptomyces cahuitamycinicus]